MPPKAITIVSGGDLSAEALPLIDPTSLLIGADKGALFLVKHGLIPDIAVGDFDSINQQEIDEVRLASREFIRCDPTNKAHTDTELALELALARAPSQITLIGGLDGARLDHLLANVYLLVRCVTQSVPVVLQNQHNRLMLVQQHLEIQAGNYRYFSLLPLTPEVTGVSLQGAKYPLSDATLYFGQTLGISNQLVAAKGNIQVREGLLLVVQSRDEF